MAAGSADIDAVSGATYTSARLQEVPPVGPGQGRRSPRRPRSAAGGSEDARGRRRGPGGPPGPGAAQAKTLTGTAVETDYGPVQVRITVTGGKITKAEAVQSPSGGRSNQISADAVPKLNQAAVAAGQRRHRRRVRRHVHQRRLQGVPAVGAGPGRWLTPVAELAEPTKLPPRCVTRRRSWARSSPSTSAAGNPGPCRRRWTRRWPDCTAVDEVFSTYREDSQISRLARGELTVDECDPEVAEVLELCAEAERLSDGWFSTTIRGSPRPDRHRQGLGRRTRGPASRRRPGRAASA